MICMQPKFCLFLNFSTGLIFLHMDPSHWNWCESVENLHNDRNPFDQKTQDIIGLMMYVLR